MYVCVCLCMDGYVYKCMKTLSDGYIHSTYYISVCVSMYVWICVQVLVPTEVRHTKSSGSAVILHLSHQIYRC